MRWIHWGVLACAVSSLASWCGPCTPLTLDVSTSPRAFELTSAAIELPITVHTPALIDDVSVSVSNARASSGAVRVRTGASGSTTVIPSGASETIALCSATPCEAHYRVVIEPVASPTSISVVAHASAHSTQCEDFYIDIAPE